ncbi:hypothetical protein [Campylobacter canadensis]|uniref:hypothetical protein n=1 Tax=Campylobacter canadensis TaxID=449520 RepID=UPI001CCBA0A8|nr:hypothetical protein [Campylobacter canadensis]MBZ8002375.1 hypothetical protein [Campylobacter canadensis]
MRRIIIFSVIVSINVFGISFSDIKDYSTTFKECSKNSAGCIKENLPGFDNILDIYKKTQKLSVGTSFLNSKCELPDLSGLLNGVNNFSICSVISKVGGELANQLQGLINNGVGFGACKINGNVDFSCAEKYIKNFCDTKENDINKLVDDVNKNGIAKLDKKQKELKSKINDVTTSVLNNTSDFLDVTGGEYFAKVETCKVEDSNKKARDNDKNKKQTIITNIVSRETNESAKELISNCLENIPTEIIAKNPYSAYNLCRVENITRPETMSEIKDKQVETAKELSKDVIVNYDEKYALSNTIKEELLSKCSSKSTLAEAQECELQNYNSKGTNAKTIIDNKKAQAIIDIEKNQAMQMAIVDKLYKDSYVDTTQGAMEKIPPNKRAYALLQAQKQDLKNSLYYSYMNKISKAKKELAKITFEKLKSCSTPFYAQAAATEIASLVSTASANAENEVKQLLKGAIGSCDGNSNDKDCKK